MDAWGLGIRGLGFGVWDFGFAAYVAGVLWGLLMIDAPAAARLGLAIVWPLGPMAFAVTTTILLAASLIAFPLVGSAILLAALVLWLAIW